MADQEVIKHTKKVLSVMAHKEHSLVAKLREIALEVVVIVFAVSTSIWLHGVSEHRHDQQRVKSFLLGLKQDLQANLSGLEREGNAVSEQARAYAYLHDIDPAAAPDMVKFENALSTVYLPRYGVFLQEARYQSFKSSGRLANIEYEKLMHEIALEFETGVTVIRYEERMGQQLHAEFRKFINDAVDSGADRYKLITSPKGKRICRDMRLNALEDYAAMAKRMGAIMKEIDAEYPDEATKAAPVA